MIAVGQWIFFFALVPSLISHHKPAFWTSFSTALILFVFVFTYISLNLVTAALSTALVAIAWSVLAIQRLALNRKLDDK